MASEVLSAAKHPAMDLLRGRFDFYQFLIRRWRRFGFGLTLS
jgi:hypothetical protein